MSRSNPNVIYDGFDDADGGMDSGRSPHVIMQNQFALLFNATTRFARLRNRPGIKKINLTWQSQDDYPDAQTTFETGRFQHASAYIPTSGKAYLFSVVNGRVFQIQPLSGGIASEVTIPNNPNASILPRGWSTQAEMFWVYNDGQSKPFIWDGAKAFRTGNTQLRPGTCTTYFLGRVWYATPSGFGFRAGDLAGVKSDTADQGGSPQYNYLDSLLNETENTYLNEGGDFLVPSSSGGIKAMIALPSQDLSFGQGPLQVFTPSVTFSVNAPVDRTIWRDLQYPIQSVSIINYGALSQDSTILVNGDIWYRSIDGLRSYYLARREFGTWGNTSQSREMDRVFNSDQRSILDHSSAIVFDNRIMCSCSPYSTDRGVLHRGLVALNLDRISSIVDKPFPPYDGVWVHQPFFQMVKLTMPLEERCYFFALDENDKLALYELDPESITDDDSPISWGLETRAFNFGTDYDQKSVDGGEMAISSVDGQVSFTAKYKQDGSECWNPWSSWDVCAKVSPCPSSGCEDLTPRTPQYRSRMGLPRPPFVTDSGSGASTRSFNEIQVKLDILGSCVLDRFLMSARVEQEQPNAPLIDETECKTVECCPEGIFDG